MCLCLLSDNDVQHWEWRTHFGLPGCVKDSGCCLWAFPQRTELLPGLEFTYSNIVKSAKDNLWGRALCMWGIWSFEVSGNECGSAGPQSGARTELEHLFLWLCWAFVADLVTRKVMVLKNEAYISSKINGKERFETLSWCLLLLFGEMFCWICCFKK